ncbi:S24 family peptidase [Brucella anthropi]|uniref:S24 family peptidase n=1 Tax=Brucella anthropi TaxID=529 RepID=UPI00216575E2|nr:helix-turn-helix transcriptional regulator [Brucella anthropi]UVV66546.1 helix-turn-helix transcriptional regulator [Brucella anthropi]
MELKDRILKAREEAGLTQQQLADATGKTRGAVAQWESGKTRPRHDVLLAIAASTGQDIAWLESGISLEPASTFRPKPNASFPPRYQEFPQDHSVPLLGQSAGGPNGRFILNGTEIGRVFCPPMLEGVEGAYAVMVYGTSMEPRYFAGETVWVNPHLPVRAGDDVIAQILENGDDQPVESYIKRFESRSSRVLRLYQYNPDEGEDRELEFDAAKVFSVHKIVFHANV